MYNAMLHSDKRDDFDTSSLRLCMSGGSAMPEELMKKFEEAFDCMILEGYGLSETSPIASFNHPDKERKPGSIGTPDRGRRDEGAWMTTATTSTRARSARSSSRATTS